jgi:hypothetical protein
MALPMTETSTMPDLPVSWRTEGQRPANASVEIWRLSERPVQLEERRTILSIRRKGLVERATGIEPF